MVTNIITKETFERLMYAKHNYGHGSENSPEGEAWDNGAKATIDLIFDCLSQDDPEMYVTEWYKALLDWRRHTTQ